MPIDDIKKRQRYDRRNAKRRKVTRDRMNQEVEANLPESAGPRYSLLDEIKNTPYYGKSAVTNDERAREFLNEHIQVMGSGQIVPGQHSNTTMPVRVPYSSTWSPHRKVSVSWDSTSTTTHPRCVIISCTQSSTYTSRCSQSTLPRVPSRLSMHSTTATSLTPWRRQVSVSEYVCIFHS